METILQKFKIHEIVVRKDDYKTESLIRITGAHIKNGKNRYRGTFTNEAGRPVNKFFYEDELKKIDR